MITFQDRVNNIVKNIPKGKIMTYAEVARAAGNSKAARAVASIMANNFDPDIPCHRVIRSDGQAGGYNRGGEITKIHLLVAEGVVLLQHKAKR